MPVSLLDVPARGGTLDHPILISACLLGIPCRYDGSSKPLPLPQLMGLLNSGRAIIPICPETRGGLTIPRLPAEIVQGDGRMVLEGKAKVINKDGADYTEAFIKGAEAILQMAATVNPELIILKSKSPSCGLGRIYDGSFSGGLRQGDGVAAALLREARFQLDTEIGFLKRAPQILGKNYS